MSETWWRERGTAPLPRRWLFHRKSQPLHIQTPLRVVVRNSLVQPVENLLNGSPEAEPVDWLLHLDIASTEHTNVVNVEERPSVFADVQPMPSKNGPHPQQLSADTEVSRPASDEPSLADRLRMLLVVPLESLLPGPNTAIDWAGNLLPYQLEGVLTLMKRDRVLLADDMGLGKTVQAVAAIRLLCRQRIIERTLLVVPASLREQWRREIALWAPELRTMVVSGTATERSWQWTADAHITIVSYETLRSDFTPNPESPPRRRVWDLVVLDEAQRIKNRDAGTSQACKQLSRRRSWALTGTPLENHLDDLASILEFVDVVEGVDDLHYMPNSAMLERHRQLQLRRRKIDVLPDLPPKHVVTLAIPLLPTQQETYQRAEREGVMELRDRGAELKIQHVLELVLRLKQICNFCSRTGESAKIDDIRNRMETLVAEGHRALVFSQFTDEIFGVEAVRRALKSYQPLTYTGSMSSDERNFVIQRFKAQPQHHALILSLRAGGVGLNLQEASYVFHLDRWWNPATERQAEDRTHRMGQVYPVTVFKYVAIGTIEERIQSILSEKQRLFDEVVDDVSLDLETGLNQSELFGLFGLEAQGPRVKQAAERNTGLALEARAGALLRRLGWIVQETPRSRDGGIDLIATRVDQIGVEECLFVQCKDYARPVGVEVVRALLGVIPTDRIVRPVLVAPEGVTPDAKRLAQQRNVLLWDNERLLALEAQ